jgi:hypothetical protein
MKNLSHFMRFVLALALSVFVATGAVAQAQGANPEDYAALLRKLQGMSPESKAKVAAIAGSQAKLNKFLKDSTLLSFSSFYGTQIEYLGADGRTFLWYPGNSVLVTGQWKVQSAGKWPEICFKYQENSYDPGTKRFGGAWECNEGLAYIVHGEEIAVGDPMSLASGKTPFVLAKKRTTLAAVMKKAGFSGHPKNKISW